MVACLASNRPTARADLGAVIRLARAPPARARRGSAAPWPPRRAAGRPRTPCPRPRRLTARWRWEQRDRASAAELQPADTGRAVGQPRLIQPDRLPPDAARTSQLRRATAPWSAGP